MRSVQWSISSGLVLVDDPHAVLPLLLVHELDHRVHRRVGHAEDGNRDRLLGELKELEHVHVQGGAVVAVQTPQTGEAEGGEESPRVVGDGHHGALLLDHQREELHHLCILGRHRRIGRQVPEVVDTGAAQGVDVPPRVLLEEPQQGALLDDLAVVPARPQGELLDLLAEDLDDRGQRIAGTDAALLPRRLVLGDAVEHVVHGVLGHDFAHLGEQILFGRLQCPRQEIGDDVVDVDHFVHSAVVGPHRERREAELAQELEGGLDGLRRLDDDELGGEALGRGLLQ